MSLKLENIRRLRSQNRKYISSDQKVLRCYPFQVHKKYNYSCSVVFLHQRNNSIEQSISD